MSSSGYKKRLEGVSLNDELLQIWRQCYIQIQVGGSSSVNVKDTQASFSRQNALKMLKEGPHPNQEPKCLPLNVLRALEALVENQSALDHTLQGTSLVFTPSPPPVEETPKRQKFMQRMDRLRLQQEETKYVRLTNNLQQEVQDDITAKSMTYAASIGLNMIVAPLSFGCFMYFFAGGIFDYFLGEEFSSRTIGGTDIKRLIVGIVSGVIMMFIEMTLFVIRTHEVEAHAVRKKKKQKPVQPFGVYSKKGDGGVMPVDPRKQSLFTSKGD